MVVIDKGTDALFGLLATCAMNKKGERDHAYKFVHGDKETFWSAFEMIKVPYYFPKYRGGTIGYPNPDREHSVCGQLYHPDDLGRPLWWNVRGGRERKKRNRNHFYANLLLLLRGECCETSIFLKRNTSTSPTGPPTAMTWKENGIGKRRIDPFV